MTISVLQTRSVENNKKDTRVTCFMSFKVTHVLVGFVANLSLDPEGFSRCFQDFSCLVRSGYTVLYTIQLLRPVLRMMEISR